MTERIAEICRILAAVRKVTDEMQITADVAENANIGKYRKVTR